ncbi:MAG: hypothetical protein EBR62_02250, partial [Verrucomicrobia bacterium]|nr:hypothetical protein [Verrucomicrobiota bacterium]
MNGSKNASERSGPTSNASPPPRCRKASPRTEGCLRSPSPHVTAMARAKDDPESTPPAAGKAAVSVPNRPLDQALREALVKAFPKLKKVHLADYKVRVLAGQDGTSAQTRVVVRSTDGARSWGTVGVS